MTQTKAQARIGVNLEGVEHDCGGHFRLLEERRDVAIGQSRVRVTQQFFRCDTCAEERQTLDQLGAARRAAAAETRACEGLLSGAEIRRIREERLEVTQGKLEKALGLGEKTVVRWETERVLQPKATDDLLRLLDRDPSALGFLADLHNVELPTRVEDAVVHGEAETELESACLLPIPRSYLVELESAACAQGVPPDSYVTWLLAERLTGLRAQHSLQRSVSAMHKDLAGRIDETWK